MGDGNQQREHINTRRSRYRWEEMGISRGSIPTRGEAGRDGRDGNQQAEHINMNGKYKYENGSKENQQAEQIFKSGKGGKKIYFLQYQTFL